ncbi:MAG: LysM peptidoglycan-binding domain-containing protein [Akkermansiaceae bacterium]
MKLNSLTPTIIAALLLSAATAASETASNLRAMIAMKESELTRVQNEITSLKKQLSSASSTAASAGTYKVQAGDTMSSIARRHKMSYKQLVELNKLTDPSHIRIDQELNIATEAPPAGEKTATKASSKANSEKHTVLRGETFYAIARTNKISVGKLKDLNPGIDANHIFVGQTLKVAGSPAPRITSTRKTSAPKTTRGSLTPNAAAESIPKATAPKKSSTTALSRSAASLKPTSMPKSSRQVSEPKKSTVKKEVAAAPVPPKKKEASMPSAPKRVSSVILTNETSFADFASKHNTSTDSLNALNGWNFPKATVLARGSEIYVPK